MSKIDDRKEKIVYLESLAQEVLSQKKLHRQRRPIVIEFCGSPKSGKTSCINSLNIFLKRNGFKTTILTERASICPIPDKESPTFNVWTCSSTINEINAEISKANLDADTGPDIIICDRGIFDALCWFRWLKSRNKMDEKEYNTLADFALLNRWQRNIDLVYVFVANPEESIRREYANLLTDKRGSIMREDILEEYRQAIRDTVTEFKEAFRAISMIDTTSLEQNQVSYEVTEKTLLTLKEMLMEKIGYIKYSDTALKPGLNKYSDFENGLKNLQFDLRQATEERYDYIQPIAVAVILSKSGDKILCVKKTEKSTKSDSPESGRLLLYVGGHMRKEDSSRECKTPLDIIRNALQREILEELGISVAINNHELPFVIYTPEVPHSKKHVAIGWTIYIDEKTKLSLDSYELIQKKGKTKSGTFIPFTDITAPDNELDSWSRIILLHLFGEKLSDAQKDFLQNNINTQMSIEF